MRRIPSAAVAATVMSLISISCGGGAPDGLELARAEARQRGVPLLLDFSTDW